MYICYLRWVTFSLLVPKVCGLNVCIDSLARAVFIDFIYYLKKYEFKSSFWYSRQLAVVNMEITGVVQQILNKYPNKSTIRFLSPVISVTNLHMLFIYYTTNLVFCTKTNH